MRLARTLAALIICPVAVCLAAPAFEGQRNNAKTNETESTNAQQSLLDAEDVSLPLDQRLELAGNALTRFETVHDESGRARAALVMAQLLRANARLADAEVYAEIALSSGQALEDATIEARASLQLAVIAGDRGNLDDAGKWLNKALDLVDGLDSPIEGTDESHALDMLRIEALTAMGKHARRLGAPEDSLEHLSRAIEISRRLNEASSEITALSNRSVVWLALARYDEALADAHRAYELAQIHGTPVVQAVSVFSLAQAHAHLWNLDRAAALWTEAITAYERAGIEIGVTLATRQRMDVWFALNDYDRAAIDGHRALELMETTGSQATNAGLLARLAVVEARRGKKDVSRKIEARALGMGPMGDGHAAYFWNELGLAAFYDARYDEARVRFQNVRRLSADQAGSDYGWRASDGLGRVAAALGNSSEAKVLFEAAIAELDQLRRSLANPNQRASLISGRIGPYERLAAAHLAESNSSGDESSRRALFVTEAWRGRVMADLLSRSQSSDPRVMRVREQEEAFAKAFSDIQTRLLVATESDRAELADELERTELAYEAFLSQLRTETEPYASLAHPQPASLDGIQRTLNQDEAAIVFLFSDETGYAWVVRHDTLSHYELDGRQSLDAEIRLLNGMVQSSHDSTLRDQAARLYETLLAPAIDELAGARRLIFVPDGPIRRLPFSMLRTPDNRWLVETFSVHRAPSLTLWKQLRERASVGSETENRKTRDALLAVAAPGTPEPLAATLNLFGEDALDPVPLKQAEREVSEVSQIFRSNRRRVLTGKEATESNLKSQPLGTYRALHFATHAAVDEVVPRRSALVMGGDDKDDGLLQLNEITNLNLSADLVVLASCRTHLGQNLRGEGLLSLGRAFMYAGARAVMASLWAVQDRETSDLMVLFYESLAEGHPADEALRIAQLKMIRKGGPSAEPKNWAGFVLTGDAARTVMTPTDKRRGFMTLAGGVFFAAVVAVFLFYRRYRPLLRSDEDETL